MADNKGALYQKSKEIDSSKTVLKEANLLCVKCDKTFSTKVKLKRHNQMVHSLERDLQMSLL